MSILLRNIAKYLIRKQYNKLRVHEMEPRDTNVSKHYINWQMLYKFKHLGEIKRSYFTTESDSQYHDTVSDVIQ